MEYTKDEAIRSQELRNLITFENTSNQCLLIECTLPPH